MNNTNKNLNDIQSIIYYEVISYGVISTCTCTYTCTCTLRLIGYKQGTTLCSLVVPFVCRCVLVCVCVNEPNILHVPTSKTKEELVRRVCILSLVSCWQPKFQIQPYSLVDWLILYFIRLEHEWMIGIPPPFPPNSDHYLPYNNKF